MSPRSFWMLACVLAGTGSALGPPTGARATTAPVHCTAPEYRQFDFWLGSWVVDREGGERAGTNRIESILGGCALRESWAGVRGGRGTSLTQYSDCDRQWHQNWVDSQGMRLDLHGGLVEGRMVLEGALDCKTDPERHRVTWEPRPDGTVRQHWQKSLDHGTTWTDVFLGIYRKAAPAR